MPKDPEIRGHCDQCQEDFYPDDYCEPYTCTSCEEDLWVGSPPHGHNCQATPTTWVDPAGGTHDDNEFGHEAYE